MKKLLPVLAILFGLFTTLSAERVESRPAATLQVGAMKSLFRDAPQGLIAALSRPLQGLIESHTGMPGQMRLLTSASEAAKMLESGAIQVAVMHSFEYGWARQSNPKLRVLVGAMKSVRDGRFALVVRQDSGLASVADLKDAKITVPFMTKEPGHLFLGVKVCDNCAPGKFFAETVVSTDPEDALNEVVRRGAQVALVEKVALDAYLRAKPRQRDSLKVLLMSEDFPTGVLVYQEGQLGDDLLARMRTGLLGAANNPKSRDLLKLIKLAGFENLGADYDAEVEELIKAYPAR